jgi:hypothetical protein
MFPLGANKAAMCLPFDQWVQVVLFNTTLTTYLDMDLFAPMFQYLMSSDGKLLVDAVGYFERYPIVIHTLQTILSPRTLSTNNTHMNSSPRSKDYCQYYHGRQDLVDLVAKKYKEDIEVFGYKYECP